jgi:hypothetical protein
MSYGSNLVVDKFLNLPDLSTYDPKDVLFSKLGRQIKSIYYKNKFAGLIPAGLIQLADFFANNILRKIFYHKHQYPIVYALSALSHINLYKSLKKSDNLEQAKKSLEWLLANSSTGYHGYCWGMNLERVTKNAKYPANIPYTTNTVYVLEALVEYKKCTGLPVYDDIIKSVYNFLEQDLKVCYTDDNSLALSYAPYDESLVVYNSNAYCMYMYAMLLPFLNAEEKENSVKKINKLYNFVISGQNGDGSWYYYSDKKFKGNFIDCFHSCFVLKNIYKTNKIVQLPNAEVILQRGYEFLKNNMYSARKMIMHGYFINDKPSFIQYELYDSAEMINLATLLGDYAFAETIHKGVMANFVSGNVIFSQIDRLGLKHYQDTLRWSVYPYIYALTVLLAYGNEKN